MPGPTDESGLPVVHGTTPPWRSPTVIKWISQLGVLAALAWLVWAVASQATTNLAARGIPLSFDFLAEPFGVKLSEGFTTDPETGLEALAVGFVNMVRISVSSILSAAVLGLVVGTARLSSNWVARKVANVYIEALRNIPILVQIVFWGAAVAALGPLRIDQEGAGWFFASAKGFAVPWLTPMAGRWQYLLLVIVGAVVARRTFTWRIEVRKTRGVEDRAVTWALGVFLAFVVIGWFAHPAMGVVGWLLSAAVSLVERVPVGVLQWGLGATAIGVASRIASKHLRRSPAGVERARLSDDRLFMLIVIGVASVSVATFSLSGPGSELVHHVLGRRQTFGMNWGIQPTLEFLAERFDFATGPPLRFGFPEVTVSGFPQYSVSTGKVLSLSYVALWIGITLYAAAFIAEIVRAGILAVDKGQAEAAAALGLRRTHVLRLVVLPQAARTIIPPLGFQFADIAKYTSLGIAVGYADLFRVGQTVFNHAGQALPIFLIWLAWYAVVTVSIGAAMNHLNRRFADAT